jgi:hypothetical protein
MQNNYSKQSCACVQLSVFIQQTYREGTGWRLETWKLPLARAEHCAVTVRYHYANTVC